MPCPYLVDGERANWKIWEISDEMVCKVFQNKDGNI